MKKIISGALILMMLPFFAGATVTPTPNATINEITPMCGESNYQEFSGFAEKATPGTSFDHLVVLLDGVVIAQFQNEPTEWFASATTTVGSHTLSVEWFDQPTDDDMHEYGDFSDQLFATSTDFETVECVDHSDDAQEPVQNGGGSTTQLEPCMYDNVRGNCPEFFRGAEFEYWDQHINVDPRQALINEMLETLRKILAMFEELKNQ